MMNYLIVKNAGLDLRLSYHYYKDDGKRVYLYIDCECCYNYYKIDITSEKEEILRCKGSYSTNNLKVCRCEKEEFDSNCPLYGCVYNPVSSIDELENSFS